MNLSVVKTMSILFFISFITSPAFSQPQTPPFYDEENVTIFNIISGDTFEMNIGARSFIVQAIGLDAPKPDKNQCYGAEAQNRVRQLLTAKIVKLEADSVLGKGVMVGGRLQRYIWVDGKLYNWMMLQEGYAQLYNYGVTLKYQNELQQAVASAQQAKKEIWGRCAGR
jgi:micrococcal nuclease